jgi:catechol 2,3-dioxygenase-like lactoylglutathione lyase family enzyme
VANSAVLPYGLPEPTAGSLLSAERRLAIEAVEHIALRVADIRRAESFYHDVFGMDIVLRARRTGERWELLPADLDWDAALRQGIYPDYCYLRNGPLALLLQWAGRGTVFVEPRLQHLSLRVSPEALIELRGLALARGYAVSEDRRHSFVFSDPFGITWHLTDGQARTGALP